LYERQNSKVKCQFFWPHTIIFFKIKMSDFDLYEDILTAKDQSKDDQITPEEIEKLQKEAEDTRKKFKRLMEINCDLKAKCNLLESNLSTLMKTCRAEINRKNDTIAGKVNHDLESHSENNYIHDYKTSLDNEKENGKIIVFFYNIM
jgi:predicted RNase H-like nuclease (RuvC/YqgF family)